MSVVHDLVQDGKFLWLYLFIHLHVFSLGPMLVDQCVTLLGCLFEKNKKKSENTGLGEEDMYIRDLLCSMCIMPWKIPFQLAGSAILEFHSSVGNPFSLKVTIHVPTTIPEAIDMVRRNFNRYFPTNLHTREPAPDEWSCEYKVKDQYPWTVPCDRYFYLVGEEHFLPEWSTASMYTAHALLENKLWIGFLVYFTKNIHNIHSLAYLSSEQCHHLLELCEISDQPSGHPDNEIILYIRGCLISVCAKPWVIEYETAGIALEKFGNNGKRPMCIEERDELRERNRATHINTELKEVSSAGARA